ncbi:ABC transporter substrate-binding protein [Petrotoga mexicana DSM 14811]|uniref:Probable sugar-binding periplasmic protein n=3 Tax=Petrotoga TaxID=28236 RepID=A0A2K1PAX3_9BACT|nr:MULTISPECIES: extracellular solute-binding protein [Petrotoga]PNR99933.1 ABC transporter substrate-binding protein [Petrotoga mexicana DSM 14811]PNS01801.1 ABC transporter substrate-binding protein [Petrotoga miotherma DSM 10691]
MRKLVGIVLLSVLSFTMIFAQSGQVEIFSWWTGGGEEEALLATLEDFNELYPDIEVINATVAGGAGTNAKAVLKTRMLGGNPPDTFQVHAGWELTDTYVIPGLMEPLTDYLKAWGVYDKFPEGLIDIVSYQGEVYSIPLTVHRSNVVFYNKKLFNEIGLTKEPETWNEFINALEKVKAAGYTPLALGDKNKWPAGQLVENLMVAEFGAKNYNALFNGELSFNDERLDSSLEKMVQLMDYVNVDHAALAWQDAARLLYEDKAVFNLMGDWAEGYFKTLGWTPGEDFGWFELPGTQAVFVLVSDTFGLPKNAPHRENALIFLEYLASTRAQSVFNPIKGSIPARIDADPGNDPYLIETAEDFRTLIISPSIVHGSAAPEAFVTSFNDAVNNLVTTKNVNQAKQMILWAAEDVNLLTD